MSRDSTVLYYNETYARRSRRARPESPPRTRSSLISTGRAMGRAPLLAYIGVLKTSFARTLAQRDNYMIPIVKVASNRAGVRSNTLAHWRYRIVKVNLTQPRPRRVDDNTPGDRSRYSPFFFTLLSGYFSNVFSLRILKIPLTRSANTFTRLIRLGDWSKRTLEYCREKPRR